MKTRNIFLALAASAGLMLGLAGPAGAVTIEEGLANGPNSILDEDRESFIDNGDGVLGIGDVFVGFVRFSDFIPDNAPSSTIDNQVYGVISNQIVGIAANGTLIMGTTDVVGLRLEDLTGDATTAGGMFAIYDSPAPYQDLVQNSAPGATTMKDNTDYIAANGTLQLVAGISDPDTFLSVLSLVPAGTPTAGLLGLDDSNQIGFFTGGLNVLVNNTSFEFNDNVSATNLNTGALATVQIAIANGAIRGYVGDNQAAVFTDASGYGAFNQCETAPQSGVYAACGFVTKADFFVDVTRIPEPATLSLFGAALFGFGLVRRRATTVS